MRKLSGILAAVAMLAATSASAGLVPTTGSLSLSLQGLAPIVINTSGTVSVSGSTVVVPAGYVALGTTLVIPVTASTAIAQLKVSKLSNLTGVFSPGKALADAPGETCPAASGQACVTGGGIGGAMALTGTIFVSVIPGVVVIPVNVNGAKVGQGGSTTSPFTFDAAPWTTGVASVNTGVNAAVTSGTGSPFTLVTPTFVLALGNLLPLFTALTLDNVAIGVPEPGTLLLLGAGVAGLVAFGRRRS
jgi:hypothetical protein